IHNAHQYLKHNDFLRDKCCIIEINNTDDLYFARALVVARAYIHKKDRNAMYKWGNIRKSDDKKHLLPTKDIYVLSNLLVVRKLKKKMYLKQMM
uniref:Uncharacterized protein n=1 Tax=Romanomermis culicivorax TaxID=13658 RepID=A0A915HPL0_ROMCU